MRLRQQRLLGRLRRLRDERAAMAVGRGDEAGRDGVAEKGDGGDERSTTTRPNRPPRLAPARAPPARGADTQQETRTSG